MTDDTALEAQYEELLTVFSHWHYPPVIAVRDLCPQTRRDVFWLKTKSGAKITRKVVEGLELLALLVHVDWQLWKHQVHKIWPEKRDDWGGQPPTKVGIELVLPMEGRVEPVFEILATSAQEHSQSNELLDARVMIQKLLDERGVVVTHIPVRISRDHFQPLGSLAYKIMQLVITQRFLDSQCKPLAASSYQGLRLKCVQLGLETQTLDASDLQCLSAIAAHDVAVEKLGAIRNEAHRDHPELVTQSLWKLLAIGSPDDDARRRGVQKFTLDRSFRCAMIPSIYSAIRASESLRIVTINPSIDGKTPKRYNQQVWPWLAYALFGGGRSSSHTQRMEKMTLHVKTLTDADVALMQNVLTAKDPVGVLMTRTASLALETVTASRFWLTDPTKFDDNDATQPSCESIIPLQDLPVLKRTKQWTTVLLPAWGQAWVSHKDVLAKTRGVAGPFAVQAIPHLSLVGIDDASKDATLALLRLVGADIRHLTLKGNSEWSLDRLFTACPHLESLEMDGLQVNSAQELVEGYVSGVCRLSRFQIMRRPAMSLDDTSLRRLFVALSDRAHPATRYLSEFAFFPVPIACMADPVMVATVVAMLEHNDRLCDFDVRFTYRDSNKSQLDRCTQPLAVFDKKKISRPRTPLDIQQRLAFLSVMTPLRTSGKSKRARAPRPSRAVERLDACVLSVIFELAAECCTRRVHVAMDGTWY